MKKIVTIALIAAAIILLGMGVWLAYLIAQTKSATNTVASGVEASVFISQMLAPTLEEQRIMEAIQAGGAANDPNISCLPTPLIAHYGDLMIHSPIAPKDITEIEFHQASYDTSLQMTPLLTIVKAEDVVDKRGTEKISWQDQPYGEKPLVANAISTWRFDSAGDEMTAVDVGAPAGTTVYAPVSGTVVKIKEYSLYSLLDDYEIHIQSPYHPELDIIVLHINELDVQVGDEIIGGCTRIGKVRNIADFIDNNLSNFTKEPDPGNHCHVQVNDATREEYRGLEGALDIFGGKGHVRPEPPKQS